MGRAAMTTAASTSSERRPSTGPATTPATRGMRTSLTPTTATGSARPVSRPGSGESRREMPKAMSMQGTATPATSSTGASTTSGGTQPDRLTTSPRTVPIVNGLVSGSFSTRTHDTCAARVASSAANHPGCRKSSCMSSTGAAQDASPRT
ncbi:MAG: hypothetical protein DI571_00875 [Arsenicicoccus sp.]|nr:MAG: hypothetical protein DI571_00875 [Arsenicicoccus sp.]